MKEQIINTEKVLESLRTKNLPTDIVANLLRDKIQ